MGLGHSAKEVAQYILWLGRQNQNPLTPMQLLKLVYIAHGWMLGLYGRPLITDQVEAWQFGPVVPDLYHAYKKYGGAFIPECPEQEPSGFDKAERGVMAQVWDHYGRLSGIRLSALTHQAGTPWAVTYRRRKGGVISNDLIEEHYRQLSLRHVTSTPASSHYNRPGA